jgi:hypothetical protein
MALVVKDFKLSKINICNQRIYFKNIFMLVIDMIQQVILEILILTQIYPFKVDSQRIKIKIFDKEIIFRFVMTPRPI